MVVCFPDQLKHQPPDQSELVLLLQFHLSEWVLTRFYTLAACLGLRKNEVLAVKKVKSSLSSSRLQYPLLMLLLLVMEGVITVLTVMEKSRDGLQHSNGAARWQLEEVLVDFFSCEKGRADVKISHDQSLHASNCPVLLQKKSALHCWCIQRVRVPPVRARQVNSAQIRRFACHRRGDQEIRERAQTCHFLLCVCSDAGVKNTHHTVDSPAHLQLNTYAHTQHVTFSHTRTLRGTGWCPGVSLQVGFKLTLLTWEPLIYPQTNAHKWHACNNHILFWVCLTRSSHSRPWLWPQLSRAGFYESEHPSVPGTKSKQQAEDLFASTDHALPLLSSSLSCFGNTTRETDASYSVCLPPTPLLSLSLFLPVFGPTFAPSLSCSLAQPSVV